MARSLLNFPVAATATNILGQAFWDSGLNAYQTTSSSNFNRFGDISGGAMTGSGGLLEYTVARSNPKLDLEFNVGSDHRTDWNSNVFRMMYKLDQGSGWSSNWSSLDMYLQLTTFNDSRQSVGNAAGALMIWCPYLNAGSKVALRLEVKIASSSSTVYLNQTTENTDGNTFSSDANDHGGGMSIRLREWDASVYSYAGDQNTSS